MHSEAAPTIERNVLSGGAHIFLEAFGDDTVVRGNTIFGAEHAGIAIYSSGHPLVEGNTITDGGTSGNEVGLQL